MTAWEMTQRLCTGTLPDSAYVTLPLADFDLYPFPVISCNCEDNSSRLAWVLLTNYQTSQWSGEFFELAS